jgi:hypothetical protein
MKLPLTALALAALAARAYANDSSGGTFQVQNPHGGYNVIQAGGPPATLPFFGIHGVAAVVAAHSHDKPKFILRPVIEDQGHGFKVTVYKKIYFATAEEAEAARLKQ